MASAFNVPINCGGVRVEAGDIILGDDDGVVVIPRELELDILKFSQAPHGRHDGGSQGGPRGDCEAPSRSPMGREPGSRIGRAQHDRAIALQSSALTTGFGAFVASEDRLPSPPLCSLMHGP